MLLLLLNMYVATAENLNREKKVEQKYNSIVFLNYSSLSS